MATHTGRRRGLPRLPGGAPWPLEGGLPGDAASADVETAELGTTEFETVGIEAAGTPVAGTASAPVPVAASDPATADAAASGIPVASEPTGSDASGGTVIRSGMPRVPGGGPWPPSGRLAGAVAAAVADATVAAGTEIPAVSVEAARAPGASETPAAPEAPPVPVTPQAAREAAPAETATPGPELRRGLPRVPGGDPWPAAGTAPAGARSAAKPAAPEPVAQAEPAPLAPAPVDAAPSVPAAPAPGAPTPVRAPAQPAAAQPAAVPPVEAVPAIAQPSAVAQAPAAQPAAPAPAPAREPVLLRGRPLAHWVKLGVGGFVGLVLAAAIVVLAARGLTTLPGMPEFLKRYPGEYAPAVEPEAGFPAWARWTHYLNFFFMVLIVRSGLLVRHQQKPPAFYTPRRGGKKVSIFLWLHTSVDLLWLANGIVFVVLLFVTGHWARIVPTSWEVFPNAASALLQYLTLEWPAEHGWVNYNSLQQLMYFTIVFVAAPLAAITGVRMSAWWPEGAARLSKAYPAPLARALHFPTMLFFVLFVLIHVFLVFATGMRRNLNHMFAGNDDGTSWGGFWVLVIGLAVVAGVWVAVRPLVLAPIAGLTGKVSER